MEPRRPDEPIAGFHEVCVIRTLRRRKRSALGDLRAAAQMREGDYRRWDGMTMELEYAELLYALVRAAKPTLIVESGSGRGVTSRFIAEALRDTGRGRLITFEPLPEFREQAIAMLRGLPAEVRPGDSRDLQPGEVPEIVFLDSASDRRVDEIRHWLEGAATPETVVIVHDANRPYPLGRHGVLLTGGDGLWIGPGASPS